jgi:hypothetical protein
LARSLRGVAGGLLRVDADDALGHALIAVLSVQLEWQLQFVPGWRQLGQPVAFLVALVIAALIGQFLQ